MMLINPVHLLILEILIQTIFHIYISGKMLYTARTAAQNPSPVGRVWVGLLQTGCKVTAIRAERNGLFYNLVCSVEE